MASGADKTEKATPKKKEDSRKKGQVAKSADLNGALVLLAALFAMSAVGPWMWTKLLDATRQTLTLVGSPSVVEREGVGEVLSSAFSSGMLAVAPLAFVCLGAGVLASVGQVGFKPSPEALKPDPKRLNPISGAKNLFGTHAVFETVKNTTKVSVVGAITILALMPKLDELASVVGMPPAQLLSTLCTEVLSIAQRAAFAYLLIAVCDVLWQRHSTAKKMKMDKQEVKDEFKQQGVPAEVRNAQRRRQMQAAQSRMMDAVPTADVVVMNPTHFAVALKYDAGALAPVCVAKGQDRLALRIRDIAREAGVTVVEEPPLARSLHGAVEVGRMIPEELFEAVAQLLAYVYRVAGARRAA